jgi:ubiquinol-cytochrome c reductase cytochrome c subunit
MSKRPFVISAVLAVCLAVLIPLWAYLSDADEDRGTRAVPANLENGRQLFDTNCGTCHTLYAAGTDGNFGPDLDTLLAATGQATDQSTIKATKQRVLNAIDNGVDSSTPGRMPAGILAGEQAEQVAEFVSQEAGN